MTDQPKSKNITWHEGDITRGHRAEMFGHRGATVWLTGLSGSGKSTLARALESRLVGAGKFAYVLDGDNVRHGLNSDLGFSPADRTENIRRIGEVAHLLTDAGAIAITAFISPYSADRDRARSLHKDGESFVEIFVDCDLATCESRDPKGLYKKARAGEIPSFTGISAPYEAPTKPELSVDTAAKNVDECIDEIVVYLQSRGFINGA